jgi:hypothetical protein
MPNLKPLTMLFVAAILVLPMGAQAALQHIYGDQFITTMQGNTLSGKTTNGSAFNIYFLPGGEVTYDDTAGVTDKGKMASRPGRRCLCRVAKPGGCAGGLLCALIEGDKVLWHSKQGSDRSLLRGGVADTFLKGGE